LNGVTYYVLLLLCYRMGIARGTASGIGAVAGGVFGMQYPGQVGFLGGALLGSLVTDLLLSLFGFHIRAGMYIGIAKGLSAVGGGVAGMMYTGIPGMMAGAFVGTLLGDILLG
jgi:hypothetical protein